VGRGRRVEEEEGKEPKMEVDDVKKSRPLETFTDSCSIMVGGGALERTTNNERRTTNASLVKTFIVLYQTHTLTKE